MTTLNNYDTSKSGLSLECTAFHDTDKSQMDFDENFQVLQHSGYRTSTIAYYIDNGNDKDSDDITFTVKGDDKAAIVWLQKQGYQAEDFATVDNGRDEILNTLTPSLLTYEAINASDLDGSGLEIVPSKALNRIYITGYSQGDYAEVLYCPDDLKAAWGNEPNEKQLKEIFTHYFYDAPIYASFKVNDEEYFYHDMPDYNEYEWTRDAFIKYVAEQSKQPENIIGQYVPMAPSY
jgi:hypothetical protein